MSGTGGIASLLAPRSLAIVGASNDESRIGGRLLKNARDYFSGPIFPVTKSASPAQGITAYASLTDIGEVPDLALVAVPVDAVASVVDDAISTGIPGLVVFTSGFAEAGSAGKDAQDHIARVARAAGTRIIGPNTIGVVNLRAGLVGTFSAMPALSPGRVAVVSQSGALGAALFRELQLAGTPASIFVATGNESDVVASEVVEEIVDCADIDVVLVCAESTTQPERYMRAGIRAIALGKTILLAKIGSTRIGARAVLGHTGAVSTDDDAFRAAMRSAGVILVDSPRALAEYVPVFLGGRSLLGRRVGILTTSGGMGIHLADAASRAGFEVPALAPSEQSALRDHLPFFASATNPVDITGQSMNDPSVFPAVLGALAASPSLDALMIFGADALAITIDPATGQNAVLEAMVRFHEQSPKLLVVAAQNKDTAVLLNSRGVPAIVDPDRAIAAIRALCWRSENTPGTRAPASAELAAAGRALLGAQTLSQHDTFGLLTLFGAETAASRIVGDAAGAIAAARALGLPVVVKMLAQELAHKSDASGVILDVRSDAEVSEAAERLLRAEAEIGLAPELEVQRMVPPGIEMFCGVRRVDGLGAVLVVGLGGHLVEVLSETETLMAEQDDHAIRRSIQRLCGGRLVSHRRGISPAALDRMVAAIGAVATLAVTLPEVVSLDVNPLVAGAKDVVIVDAVCHTTGGEG